MSNKYLVPVPSAKWKKVEVKCITTPDIKLKIEEDSRGRVKIEIYNHFGSYALYMCKSSLTTLAKAIDTYSDQINEEE